MILNKLIIAAVMGAFLAGADPMRATIETLSKVTASTPNTTAKPMTPSNKTVEKHRKLKSKALEELQLKTSEERRPKNKTSEELRTPKKLPMSLVERACDVMGCDTVAAAFAALAGTVRKATSGGDEAETTGGNSPETTAGSTPNPTPGSTGATGNNEMCFDRLGCFPMGSPWSSRSLNSPEEIDTLFRIYTRNTPSNEEAVMLSPIDADPDLVIPVGAVIPERPTFFLVHGFNDFGDAPWLIDLKDAILSKVDGNVFIVDWKKGATARLSYSQVASNTRIVGAEIAGVIQALGEHKITPRDVHIIGHSLGAHIAGFAGKDFDGEIGRITALDPAQPGFEGHPVEVRIAQTDALFVDAIHTNGAPFIPAFGLGMMGAVGDVDFFVNGGALQPGCLLPPPPPVTALFTDPVNVFGDMFACSHKRAMALIIEAIKGNCVFWGRAKKLDRAVENTASFAKIAHLSSPWTELPKPPVWCATTTCVPMGLLTPLYGVRGNFDVTTTAEAPFCLKSIGLESAFSSRLGGGGTSSLLEKLTGGVLGQRKKRSRESQSEYSIFSWFRSLMDDNWKSNGKINAITE